MLYLFGENTFSSKLARSRSAMLASLQKWLQKQKETEAQFPAKQHDELTTN